MLNCYTKEVNPNIDISLDISELQIIDFCDFSTSDLSATKTYIYKDISICMPHRFPDY